MKIDLYGPATTEATNLSVGKASNGTSQVSAQPASTEDKTTFSSSSAAVQSLTKTATQTFPSRESRVESLRQAVNSAQYQLDADKIAESLVNADF